MPDSNITKRELARTLRRLLETTPFEKVSVSDICRACDMNRKSFYYHFRDKFELVEWIWESEFIEVVRSGGARVDWDLALRLCEYFAENRPFYQKTLVYEGQNSFTEYLHDIMESLVLHELEELTSLMPEKDELLLDFARGFYTDALAASIKRWVLTGEDISPERYVALLQACLYEIAGYSRHRPDSTAAPC